MARLSRKPPSWVSEFVGIPFVDGGRSLDDHGLDCYGLCRVVLDKFAGIKIEPFSMTVSCCDKDRQFSEIVGLRDQGPWVVVARGSEVVFDVAEIAIVYRSSIGFRVAGLHMGIVVAKSWMLHTQEASGVICERYDRAPWDKRIDRFWRVAG